MIKREAEAGPSGNKESFVTAGGVALEPGEYELVLETTGRPEGEALALLSGSGFVILDTTTTPELEAEGLARDVIRAVQDTRKAAGFEVSDRIRLQLLFAAQEDAEAVAAAFAAADVAGETLALDYAVVAPGGEPLVAEGSVLASADTIDAEHTAVVPAGTYANRGDLTVAVTRIGGAQ